MAYYPSDAIGIFSTDSFSSMADYTPDKGHSYTKSFSTIVFSTDAGYEKRRLRSRRPVRDYTLTYTNATGLQKNAIETFYNNRNGDFESFTLDLSHIGETGNVTVRFAGGLSVSHVESTGSNLLASYYSISFKLKEVFG